MSRVRVLLVDDHALVRAGIRGLLEARAGVEVIAEASDGSEAVELTRAHRPDVVLMDLTMKGKTGLEATAQITKEFPQIHVIILSMHTTHDYVTQALRAGAAGYLIKDCAPAELDFALSAALRGDRYLSPRLSKPSGASSPESSGAGEHGGVTLTPRQREILPLIAAGLGTKEIAYKLNISVKTVETHRSQLMHRLDIHDVPGLVRYAIRTGLVSPER
jgi:DNA-binding NarL/FixJ family response regulator